MLITPPAAATNPAIDRRRQADQITLCEVCDPLADLCHMTGHLMTEDDTQSDPLGLLASEDPQIGTADRVGTDTQHHLTGTSFGFG